MMKNVLKYYKIFIIIGFFIYGLDKIYSAKCELAFSTESNYIEGYEIVDKNIFKESFINYLYRNEFNDYISKIYDYETKQEMDIKDLIKEKKIIEYNDLIKELISLKYPEFISTELAKGYGKNSYLFKDNELIIYFNNYNIETNEILYLRVNYNSIYEYLNFSVPLDKEYKNESGFDYVKDKKTIAFTFDDSPSKEKTNKLIEILNKNYARATFFMVGEKMNCNKELVKYVAESGNEIGSHSYSHKNFNKLSKEEIIKDYESVNNLYYEITGNNISLFRPPYGITKNEMLYYNNVAWILWSVDTLDWKYRNKDYLVNYVLNNISDGDIVLFHDTYRETIDSIEELLPLLYKKGFQVVNVSKLAELKDKPILMNHKYHNFK